MDFADSANCHSVVFVKLLITLQHENNKFTMCKLIVNNPKGNLCVLVKYVIF